MVAEFVKRGNASVLVPQSEVELVEPHIHEDERCLVIAAAQLHFAAVQCRHDRRAVVGFDAAQRVRVRVMHIDVARQNIFVARRIAEHDRMPWIFLFHRFIHLHQRIRMNAQTRRFIRQIVAEKIRRIPVGTDTFAVQIQLFFVQTAGLQTFEDARFFQNTEDGVGGDGVDSGIEIFPFVMIGHEHVMRRCIVEFFPVTTGPK